MIDPHSIEQVKQAAKVTEVVGKYLQLKRNGENMVACCPFHNEKSPSFTVNDKKGLYKCFGCGESGDSVAFLMKHGKKTYMEAIEELAAMYHIDLRQQQEIKKYIRPTAPATSEISENALAFFRMRGIDADTVKKFRITTGTEWMPKAKKEVEVIRFHYWRGETLVNTKYRGKDKDFKLHKDAELIFYNLDAINGSDYVIITEGEIDCLSVAMTGAKHVISVPNGASKSGKLEYLNNCYEELKGKKQIILMTDSDEPGQALRDELARRLGYDKCMKVQYPDGCKDANDVLMKHGLQALKDVITNAEYFPVEGVYRVEDFLHEIDSYYLNGYPNGYKCGIPSIDEHMQFMLGQFTTWTGIPGSGKSEMVDNVMVALARNADWRWAVCSPENQPCQMHITKLMEKYAKKSFIFRNKPEDRMTEYEKSEAENFINEMFYFLNINKIDMTLDGILEKFAELILRYGVKGLLLDPWNYVEHKRGGMSETDYVSESLTKIKSFCIRHNVHIFLVAHPTKIPKSNGKYEVPTLYSISGSAHFFNKTDNGITMYRHFDTGIVEMHFQKIRYSWLGKIGMVEFGYDVNRRQYYTPGDEIVMELSPPVPENPYSGIKRDNYIDYSIPYQHGEKQQFTDNDF